MVSQKRIECTGQAVLDLVGNPEGQFSRVAAQSLLTITIVSIKASFMLVIRQ